MAEHYEATCPECDNIIEISEEEAQIGNFIQCDNYPCFFEGEVEQLENEDGITGQVYFKKESE